jgi:ATP/maltotriose-dependent transcriptional regulator MalT
VGGDGALARSREAAERLAWADAYTALSLADRSSSLAGEDLELLATAAYLLGRVEDCMRALQRAQQLHSERGDPRRAARCAFWMVFHLINQGELARASGWLARAAAEDAYQQASHWGLEPQPGLALLRLAQGSTDAAEAAIRRVVAETSEKSRRAKPLLAHVEIMLAIGEVQAAADAAGELVDICERYNTPALRALAGHAQGAVLLAEGDGRAAVAVLRGTWQVWRELEAPYEAARVRVLMGPGFRMLGDDEAAAMELDAARGVFAQLGAAPDLARLETLDEREAASKRHGLTPRELEVLRLLAAGKTNHAIASDLVLAEKTVDRHVSNIYTKLGVSSRAAATAFVYQHRLL